MRIHRIFTLQPLEPGAEVQLEERASHYLARVLRVASGQSVVLFNGDGHDYASEVLWPIHAGVVLRVDSRLPGLPEPPVPLAVAQAMSRGERMDQTLQKCTELGAAAFQLLESERVELRLRGDKLEKRMAHWRGVLVAACEQCGRARVPDLLDPLSLDEWLLHEHDALRLVLDPDAGKSLAAVGGDLDEAPSVELLVGPEGGFSDAEMARIDARGVRRVSLGPRILRTETAAPAALALLQGLIGDLR